MSPRRIPTKAELLRLQKLYRTDKRIADTLGNGVTEHLVAYWRRKKGVPSYSFPKFSEKDIHEVWDRFGDDFHAGMELGLSKAAFYNWRRRYKITKKPEALKLEQLSLELFTDEKNNRRQIGTGRQSIFQKALAQNLGVKETKVGKEFEIEPDLVLACGNINEMIRLFQDSGTTYIWNSARVAVPCDNSDLNSQPGPTKAVKDFIRLQQIKNFFGQGMGNSLQLAIERGLVLPGHIIIGGSNEIAACGALGALAVPGDITSMVSLWCNGRIKIKVPETVKVIINGRFPRGVFVRDLVHNIVSQLDSSRLSGRMIEFYGSAVDQMTISERITLCCLVTTTGAYSAVCPFDATTRRYVNPRARKPFIPLLADRNTAYASEYNLDVNTMKPVALSPNDNKVQTLDELNGLPVQYAFIGGIANGRYDDLKIAADIVKGKQLNPDTRLYIQPASQEIYLKALKKGLLRLFIEAGAIIREPGLPPGNGPHPSLGDGEVGLSTYVPGCINPGQGRIYQVSPATAAVAAVQGQLTNPAEFVKV